MQTASGTNIHDGRVGIWAFLSASAARAFIVEWEPISAESSLSTSMHGPMNSFRVYYDGEIQGPTNTGKPNWHLDISPLKQRLRILSEPNMNPRDGSWTGRCLIHQPWMLMETTMSLLVLFKRKQKLKGRHPSVRQQASKLGHNHHLPPRRM